VACALNALGDNDSAVDWVTAAARNGYPCPTFFALDPLLEPLRANPGYARLIPGLEDQRAGFASLFRGLPGQRS
jgi:hypothetical protein